MPAAEELDGEDLLQALMSPSPSEVFNFIKVDADGTHNPFPVRVRLLRIDEDHQALRAAQAYAKANKEIPQEYGDIYKEAQAIELLTKALCRVKERETPDGKGTYYPPLFVDSAQLRKRFSSPELAQCLNMYSIVRSRYGSINYFSDEEFEAWIAKLADPLRGPFWLSQLDSSHWPLLLLRLAQALQSAFESSQMPSNSPTSSESDQHTSSQDTSSFTELPAAHSGSGTELPTDHVLTAEEAAELVRSPKE